MFGNPMEIAIIAGVAVLLFGADRLPKLARGLGQAKKEFQAGQSEGFATPDDAAAAAAERAHVEAAGAQAQAARIPAEVQPQTANGVVVGAPGTSSEPAAPPN